MLPGAFDALEAIIPRPFALVFTVCLELLGAALAALVLSLLVASLIWAFSRLYPASGIPIWSRTQRRFEVMRDDFQGKDLPESDRELSAIFLFVFATIFIWSTLHDLFPGTELAGLGLCLAVGALWAASILKSKWPTLKQAAARRFPNSVAVIVRVAGVIKFCLWGWVRTRWGLRLATAASGIYWISVSARTRMVLPAVAITVVVFAVLYVVGKGLSKLHQFLHARGFQRGLDALEALMWLGVLIIVIGSTSQNTTRDDYFLFRMAVGLSLLAPLAFGWGLPPEPQARKYGDAAIVDEDALKAKGIIDER
jgi:hypothetical protein